MAKETFILRTEWWDAISELNAEDKSNILEMLFMYHLEQPINTTATLSVRLVWKLIEPNLRRNISAYDLRSETSKQNGKLGGRKPNNNLKEPNKPNETLSVSVSDSDTVSGSVSDSEPPTLTASGKVFFIPSKLDDFKPPTFGEVKQCFSQQKPTDWDYTKSLVLAEKFYTNYEANGWKINGMPIGNWQALVKKWILKEIETPKNGNKQSVSDKAATGIELAKAALAKSLNKIATSRGLNNPEEVCSTANAKPYT